MAEMLDWQDYLDPEDANIPLHALRYTCMERISWCLNKPVQMRDDMQHVPNFGGLGELIGLDGIEISEMSRRENPSLAVLDLWRERINLSPTVGNLIKYLSILGREDILTDMEKQIKEEIKIHKERKKNLVIQDTTVSSNIAREDANRVLTIDDVESEGITIYDAFICYDKSNINFVQALIAKLEDPYEYGFKFFVPGRNNLIGTNNDANTTKIISERCRHMIVVLSNSFLQSAACEFQTAYAFSLSQGARDKKIVPIKVEDCKVPDILQIVACCDFTNTNLLDWSWQRLAMSIKCPMPNPDFLGPQRFVPPRTLKPKTSCGGGPFTFPIARRDIAPPNEDSSSNDRPRHAHTAPVSVPSTSNNDRREKSPSTMSQAFKRVTQTFSSKTNKKQHKAATDM